MTAAEKRKYLSAKVLDLLAPYGYFSRYGSVWRYSLSGKYVVQILFDLTRYGNLNELTIRFGSFFSVFERVTFPVKGLALGNGVELLMYMRNAMPESMPGSWKFEITADYAMHCFEEVIYPLMPKDDDLTHYLECSEKLVQLNTVDRFDIARAFWHPMYIDEIPLAYLSMGDVEKALQMAEKKAEYCQSAADDIRNHPEMYKYDIEEKALLWENYRNKALSVKDSILNDMKKLKWIMEGRENEALQTCRQFFHIKA